ncbi:MAG TPA: hypothetical protein VGG16_12860 [Streptosporangiaceae bacterium]|jgi:hypothetical protein
MVTRPPFLQAFIALDRLRDPERFAGWLAAIVSSCTTTPGCLPGRSLASQGRPGSACTRHEAGCVPTSPGIAAT